MDQLAAYLDARLQPLVDLAQQNGTADQVVQAQRIADAARELAAGCADGGAFEQRFAQSPLFNEFNTMYSALFMQGPQAAPVSVKEAIAAGREARAQLSDEERAAQDAEMKESVRQAAIDDVKMDACLLAKEARVAIGRENYQRMREESPEFREIESAVNTVDQVKRIGRLFRKH